MLEAIFFDLDGTLADTAPDLGAALNRLLEEEGRRALPAAKLRPHVSAGSRGLIGVGFGLTPADADFRALQDRFLAHYAAALCIGTSLFPGMSELLDELDRRQVKWGIVTNKPHRFTLPLVHQLGLSQRSAAVVSGDTTAHAKPHPEPLLFACRTAGVAPAQSLYVGDDLRDIQAGRSAGMHTAIASYGYLGDGPVALDQWQADATIEHPMEIIGLLDRPGLK